MASLRTIKKITKQAKLTSSYLVFMAMAGVLAAVALLTDSVPILIGSMVIAPALPPLGLVSLAIVVRKPRLALRGLTTAFLGFLIAMAFAMLTTWILNITQVIRAETNLLNKSLLEERVKPGWYSVIAAMAAGVSGAVALIKQKTDTLVGVVAALALVPAVAAAGIAFLSKNPVIGFGGLFLLGINVGFIIISGVLTIIVLRPEQRE
ncbi:DUF389 domain-containing protein [Pleurocapsa sp. FMAR1]|uniref:DUF389 domain-containing protein n=1 Tax=Pleurocapsa sp. FMAR1 TaxID=3040204 RepID=UPI0029C6E84E|nr:DUF389 domain-containing protein [Pleurocapsa sp. FMAR1]